MCLKNPLTQIPPNISSAGFEDKYLGFPTPEGRMNKGKFQSLQEKVWKRILLWGENHLSVGGKEILIKSVLQAIPVYVMGIFKIPDSVCDELTKAVRNFWWGADREKRKTHWRAWDTLIKPKQCGGMGFRDFKLFNQALLARQAWRILDNLNSLCARVLKAKYFPNGSIIDTSFGGNSSPGWKGIEYGLELLKKGIIWRVGNGHSIRIWRDPWLPRDFSRRPITRKGNCRIKWVPDLLNDNGEWDLERIQQHFNQIDTDIILKIRPSRSQEADFVAWHPDKHGIFSVRSAYHLAVSLANVNSSSSSSGHDLSKAWKLVWNCNIPQKVKIFAWKAATNSLATLQNKKTRRLEPMAICSICGREEEDVAHALCRCPHATNLWLSLRSSKDISFEAGASWSGSGWILDQLGLIAKEEGAMFLMLLWRIWYNRNEIYHGKSAPPVSVSHRFIVSYVSSLREIKQFPRADFAKGKFVVSNLGCMKGTSQVPDPKVLNHWEKPNPGWMKLNVDGSFDARYGSGGIGAVLRNSAGSLIFCGNMSRCGGALEAELLACREGIIMALQWTLLPFIVETDSLELLKLVGAGSSDRSELAFLVKEVRDPLSGNREIIIRKIHRENNCVSDFLANKGGSESLTAFWPDNSCDCISHLVGVDSFVE